MYVTPSFAPLDLAATAASCCRVIVRSGETGFEIVNQPFCPFPAPTGDVCVATTGTTTFAPAASVCVLAS